MDFSINEIEDPSDFTLFRSEDPGSDKISFGNGNEKTDNNLETTKKSPEPEVNNSQSSSNQKPFEQKIHYSKKIQAHPVQMQVSHTQHNPLQMNIAMANSILMQQNAQLHQNAQLQNAQLQQNAALMGSPEMWPGILESGMCYPGMNPMLNMSNPLGNNHLLQLTNFLMLQQLNSSDPMTLPQEIQNSMLLSAPPPPLPQEIQNSMLLSAPPPPLPSNPPPLNPPLPIAPDQIPSELRATRSTNAVEVIRCKQCTLYAPRNPTTIPLVQKKPPNCKTIWVGGLPKNITESIIRDVFERFGEFDQLRKRTSVFCHIRYKHEESVDKALSFSGYRLVIGNGERIDDSGLIFVDYSKSREDIEEWNKKQQEIHEMKQQEILKMKQQEIHEMKQQEIYEIKQQSKIRENEQLLEKQEKTAQLPPPIKHSEINAAIEKIKNKSNFIESLQLIISWFKNGSCNKYNVQHFYNIIQAASSHAKKIQKEKVDHQAAVNKVKLEAKKTIKELSAQINQIENLFGAACHQKVWDHFSKTQRKAIETWKAELEAGKCVEDDMEISDEDEPATKKAKLDTVLMKKNEKLKCEIQAFKNEIFVLKNTQKAELEESNRRVEMLTNTLKTTKNELMKLKIDQSDSEIKIKQLEEIQREAESGPNKKLEKKLRKIRNEFNNLKTAEDSEAVELQDLKTKLQETVKENENNVIKLNDLKQINEDVQKQLKDLELKNQKLSTEKSTLENKQNDYIKKEKHTATILSELNSFKNDAICKLQRFEKDLTEARNILVKYKEAFNAEEARIIGLVSSFLLPFCFGMKIEGIFSYVKNFQNNILQNDLESVMTRCHTTFKKNADGAWVLNIYNKTELPEVDNQKVAAVNEPIKSEESASTSQEQINTIHQILNNGTSDTSKVNNNQTIPSTGDSTSIQITAPTNSDEDVMEHDFNAEESEKANENDPSIQSNFTNKPDTPLPKLTPKEPQELTHSIEKPTTRNEENENKNETQGPAELSSSLTKINTDFKKCDASGSRKRKNDSSSSSDSKEAKLRKRSGTGNLKELLEIYNQLVKEDKPLLETPASIPIHSLLQDLKHIFKHIMELKPFLNQIQDNAELKKHFSVLSEEHCSALRKLIAKLPFQIEDVRFSGIFEEKEVGKKMNTAIHGRFIKKHTHKAQKRLTKLRLEFGQIRDSMVEADRMTANYESLFINVLKYLERVDFSLSMISSSVDRVMQNSAKTEKQEVLNPDGIEQTEAMQNSVKDENEVNPDEAEQKPILGTYEELVGVYLSITEKNIKMRNIYVPYLNHVISSVKSLSGNIAILRLILVDLGEKVKSCMIEDYDWHITNLVGDYFAIIERILKLFVTGQVRDAITSPINVQGTVKEKIHVFNHKAGFSLDIIKTIEKSLQKCDLLPDLEKEFFNECVNPFDSISKYLTNLDKSLNVFRAAVLEINDDPKGDQTTQNTALDNTNYTGSFEEIDEMYSSLSKRKCGESILPIDSISLLRNIYLGVIDMHKLVTKLRLYLNSLKDCTNIFMGEESDDHFKNISGEYFVLIKNALETFPIGNKKDIIKSKDLDTACRPRISVINETINLCFAKLNYIENDLNRSDIVQLLTEERHFFCSIRIYFSKLKNSLFAFSEAAKILPNDPDETKSSESHLSETENKFTGSLEELNSLLLKFCDNTQPSEREEIYSFFETMWHRSLKYLRKRICGIRYFLNKLQDDVKRFKLELLKEDPIFSDEYFSILYKCLDPTTQEEENVLFPTITDSTPFYSMIYYAKKEVRKLRKSLLPSTLNDLEDFGNFFESFKQYLQNLLVALFRIRDGDARLQILNRQLSIKGKMPTKNSNDVSIENNSDSVDQNVKESNMADSKIGIETVTKFDTSQPSSSASTINETNLTQTANLNEPDNSTTRDEIESTLIDNPGYAEDNLKAMIETYKIFKNDQSVQFPADVKNIINEYSLNSMVRADELLAELHVNIIIIRALVYNLKDNPDHRQALCTLSEDYFVMLNEFTRILPIENVFNIVNNYENARNFKLVLDKPANHFSIYKMFKRRVRRIIPKLQIQFEQIRNITIKDQKVFSKNQDFFQNVLKYLQNFHHSLISLRKFFSRPENANLFQEIYADNNNIYPLHYLMDKSKMFVFLEDKNENPILQSDANEREKKLKKIQEMKLNIKNKMVMLLGKPVEKNELCQAGVSANHHSKEDEQMNENTDVKNNPVAGSSGVSRVREDEVFKMPEVPIKKLKIALPKTVVSKAQNEVKVEIAKASVSHQELEVPIKKKTENDDMSHFAKGTQDLRNELRVMLVERESKL